MNDYPKTTAEWWAAAADPRMVSIIRAFHPWYSSDEERLYRLGPPVISAPRTEAFLEGVRHEIAAERRNEPPHVQYAAALTAQDGAAAAEILNQAWFGMPEAASSRDVDGFGAFCDLCSESHLVAPHDES